MSIQAQVLDALRQLIDDLGCYARVTVGPLPPEGGLSLAPSGGAAYATLAGGWTAALDVVLNARHERQSVALEALCSIHEALARRDDWPAGEGWQIVSVRPASAPGYLDREGGQWLYGSALTLHYTAD